MRDTVTQTTGAEVVLTGVEKAFGANAVLSRLDLAIRPGEFLSIVGKSGAEGERVLVVTASAFSLPACTCGQDAGMLSNMNCTWPPIRSCSAGGEPL